MRLMASILSLLVAVPFSGCVLDEVFQCDTDMRKAEWVQENIPTQTGVISKGYSHGDFSGTLNKDAGNPELRLRVYDNDPVSHDELVEFAEAMFAHEGWPPPELEGAEEETGCSDVV